MKNYYGLVASMPDVSPDDAKLNFTVADFKEDYWPQLSETDKKLVALFFLRYDIAICWHGWPRETGRRSMNGRCFRVKRGPRPWRR